VLEPHPEGLARHLLLAHALLDPSLPLAERARLLPELHGNAALTRGGAAYLARAAAELEEAVHEASWCCRGGGGRGAEAEGEDEGEKEEEDDGAGRRPRRASALARLLDLRALRHRERDALADVFARWRRSRAGPAGAAKPTAAAAAAAAAQPPSLQELWEARLRRRLGARYDGRADVADCDYHLRARDRSRLVVAPVAADGVGGGGGGVGGGNGGASLPALSSQQRASLLCREHYVHWRLTGVAHELRGRGGYAEPNASLVSAAEGRLLPRGGQLAAAVASAAAPFARGGGGGAAACGPSVVASGYWGDVTTGPFVCFGGVPLWTANDDDEEEGGGDENESDDDGAGAERAAWAAMAEAALAGEGPGLLPRRSTVDAAELNARLLLRRLYGPGGGLVLQKGGAHLALKARGPTTEEDLAAAAAAAAAEEEAAAAATAAGGAERPDGPEEEEEEEEDKGDGDGDGDGEVQAQARRESELWERGLRGVRLVLGLLDGDGDAAGAGRGLAAVAAAVAPAAAPVAAAAAAAAPPPFDVVALGARQTTAALLEAAAASSKLLLLVEDAGGSVALSDARAGTFRERVRGAVSASASASASAAGRSGGGGGWVEEASWPLLVAPGQVAFVRNGAC
jgi:hypothetical protein